MTSAVTESPAPLVSRRDDDDYLVGSVPSPRYNAHSQLDFTLFWKFNNSLLGDNEFVKMMREGISDFKRQ